MGYYLSDTTRRRIAAVLLVVGIVVAVLAITDTGPLFDDPPTEEERAQEAVEEFFGAAAGGDFVTYCSLLTPAARDRIRANAARLLEEAGQLKCDEILEVAAERVAGISVRILEVSVSGAQARVEANTRVPDDPAVESRTMFLELDEAGNWRIADPG